MIQSAYSRRAPRQKVIDELKRTTEKYYGKGAWDRQFNSRRISNGKFVSSEVRSRQYLKMPKPLWWSFGLGIVFSAIHTVAWNWDFPTPVERLIWRIASSGAVLSCAVIGLSLLVSAHLTYKQRRSVLGGMLGTLLFLFLGVYIAARFIIIVQMFACFRSSPPGLYEDVDFSRYLPHFS